ncbi:hypothetical protein ACJX0J_012816, partial [Zea mays]
MFAVGKEHPQLGNSDLIELQLLALYISGATSSKYCPIPLVDSINYVSEARFTLQTNSTSGAQTGFCIFA